jgi:hypothetical protein
VVERRPLDREVRGSNPSYDTMALLGRHCEFPQCGIIKEKLLLLFKKCANARFYDFSVV